MGRLSILAIWAAAIFAAGCGGGDDRGAGSASAAETSGGESTREGERTGGEAMRGEASGGSEAAMVAKRRRPGKKVQAVGSTYGRVIADRRGEAFYLFDREKGKRSRCYGACARAWPPVITKGRPRAGKGVKARLLGTTKRRNGKRQVTYRGHPLYYYVDDSPGRILCQNVSEFGGLWLVVKPNGRPVA